MQRSEESTHDTKGDAVVGDDPLDSKAVGDDTIDSTVGVDADLDASVAAGSGGAVESTGSGLFSPKAFALSVGLAVLGVVAGGAIPLVGSIGSLVGVFLAAFLVGLVAATRRYLEVVVAGGGVLGVQFALSVLSTGVLPVGWQFFQQYGPAFAAVGVGLGALLSALGHHFGRDLRTGLTREL